MFFTCSCETCETCSRPVTDRRRDLLAAGAGAPSASELPALAAGDAAGLDGIGKVITTKAP